MDLTAIRTALAAQITAETGLRCLAQPRDQVSPPMAVIMPGNPLIAFGADMYPGSVTVSLTIVLMLSDAPPVEKTQRALDAYLGIGSGEEVSLAAAIMADVSLGGNCSWCVPQQVTSYGRVEYAAEIYFGAQLGLSIGA